MMSIEQLFATADAELAMQQMEATYPYLRELAGFIFNEDFPPPTGKLVMIYIYTYIHCMYKVVFVIFIAVFA